PRVPACMASRWASPASSRPRPGHTCVNESLREDSAAPRSCRIPMSSATGLAPRSPASIRPGLWRPSASPITQSRSGYWPRPATLEAGGADCEAALGRLLTGPAELAAGLASAGLPVRFGDLPEPVDDELARWAVANCALQRRRFGVADLAMLMGVWEDEDVE